MVGGAITFTDYWIRASGLSSFPGKASEAVAKLDGVQTVTAIRPAQVTLAGLPHYALAIQPRTLTRVARMPTLQGDLSALAGDSGTGTARIALSDHLATALGAKVGHMLPVSFAGSGTGSGKIRALVVATYDTARIQQGLNADVLVSHDRAAAAAPLQGDTLTMVELRDDVNAAEIRPALDAALRGYPVVLQDAQEARVASSGRIGSVLALGLALLLLTVVIALFGITNTLALSVHERTRELGLLRAVGMTRTQARSMVRGEAVIVTILGTLLGVALGTFFAWGMTRAVPAELEVFSLPIDRLAITVTVAVAAGLLAASVPARRASRIDVLRAIATE